MATYAQTAGYLRRNFVSGDNMYAKKELFSVPYLVKEARITIPSSSYPPNVLKYYHEGNEVVLYNLGESNKNDLVKMAGKYKDEDDELSSSKNIKQFVYTDAYGELFEVCVIECGDNVNKLSGIRTRRKN